MYCRLIGKFRIIFGMAVYFKKWSRILVRNTQMKPVTEKVLEFHCCSGGSLTVTFVLNTLNNQSFSRPTEVLPCIRQPDYSPIFLSNFYLNASYHRKLRISFSSWRGRVWSYKVKLETRKSRTQTLTGIFTFPVCGKSMYFKTS